MTQAPSMTLQRVENIISHVLRIGVIVSLLVIVTGTVISFVHHPGYLGTAKELPPLTAPHLATLPTVRSVIEAALAGHGQALVMVGLMFLIATPVLRVAVSIGVFVLQRDWVFVVITATVLAALLLSFWIGRAE